MLYRRRRGSPRNYVIIVDDARVIVGTNIKRFAPGAREHYLGQLAPTMERLPGVDLVLSVEDPRELKHDLVGLLRLLAIMGTEKPRFCDESQAPTLLILDGGKKSRNYLLTLFFGYQGLYSLLGSVAWEASVISARSLASQFPGGGLTWAVLAASDYDIVPSHVTVGGAPLASVDGSVDVVLFTHPPAAAVSVSDETSPLRRRRQQLEDICSASDAGPDQAFHAICRVADDAGDAELRSVAEELNRMSSKGVLLVDAEGRLLQFREKPSIPVLLAMSRSGQVMENVMYVGLAKRLLPLLAAMYGSDSASYPGRPLKESIAFGFFATLFAAPHMSQEEWDRDWAAGRPKEIPAEAWAADGAQLQREATAFFGRRTVRVASFGEGARVADMGEPRFYLETIAERAFTDVGRSAAGLTSDWCIGSSVSKSVTLLVANSARLLLYNSAITGTGRVVIANENVNVIVSNSLIHVPAGSELNIGPRSCSSGTFLIESSYVGGGGTLDGSDALVVGWSSHVEARGRRVITVDAGRPGSEVVKDGADEDEGERPLLSSSAEVVCSLALLAFGELPAVWGEFRVGLDVVANKAVPGKRKLLDEPALAGRTFEEALTSVDFSALREQRATLSSAIRTASSPP